MTNTELDHAAALARNIMRSTRTWDPENEPTALEWTEWFRGLLPQNAEIVAHYLLLRMAAQDQCFIADHTGSIRDLENVIGRVQEDNRRLRAQLLRFGSSRQDQPGGASALHPREQDQR